MLARGVTVEKNGAGGGGGMMGGGGGAGGVLHTRRTYAFPRGVYSVGVGLGGAGGFGHDSSDISNGERGQHTRLGPWRALGGGGGGSYHGFTCTPPPRLPSKHTRRWPYLLLLTTWVCRVPP